MRRGEKGGVALLSILGLVSLIGIMAFMVNRMSGMAAVMESGNEGNEIAYYVAEAGIQNAIWEIKQNGGWLAGFTNKAFGSGTYSVLATDIGGNRTKLVSTGISGNSKKTIQVQVSTSSSSCAPTQDTFTANDTYIEKKKKNNNFDGSTKIKIDKDKKRGLLFFDLSTIPSGATVQSATLGLQLFKTKKNDTVKIYRITSEWIDSEVTWKKRKTGVKWKKKGGDFNGTLEGSLPSNGAGWKEAIITTLVQSWVDGSNDNFGILLRKNKKSDEFRSSEYSQASKRPKLTVGYSPC